jgi:arthrofactin-type cyclic lipopeptide synthetase C
MRLFPAQPPPNRLQISVHSCGLYTNTDAQRRERAFIGSLTILDSEPPTDDDAVVREYDPIEMIMAWIETFEELLERPLGIGRSDLDLPEAAQRELLHGCLVREGLLPRRSQAEALRGPLRTFATSLRTTYKPDHPYFGSARLLPVNCKKLDQGANRRNREHLTAGWKRWAPDLACLRVPGNHMTVLRQPHVLVISKMLTSDACGVVEKSNRSWRSATV